jgi:LysM repeat protein
VIHVVQAGDTLFDIALAYAVTVRAIIEANGLDSDRLSVGQQLIIPVATPVPPGTGTPTP